jgi:hypothetical protein
MNNTLSKKEFNKDYFNLLLKDNDALNEISEILVKKLFCEYNIDYYSQEIFKFLIKKRTLEILHEHKDLLVNFDIFVDLMSENLRPENLEKDVTDLRIKITNDLHSNNIYKNLDMSID